MLLVNKMYAPEIGGVEVIVQQVAEILCNEYPITVLAFNNGKKNINEEINGVKITRLGCLFAKKSNRWSLKYLKTLKHLSSQNETVIFNYPSLQPEFYKRKYNFKNKIVYYHADNTKFGPIGRLYQSTICKRFLANADVIIVSNPNIIKSSKVLRHYEEKCIILPYGIDTAHYYFRQDNKRDEILKKFNTKDAKLVLFVGRLVRYKGIMNLLEAMTLLDEEYKLVLVSNSSLSKKALTFIDKNNISGRIVHYKNVSDDDLPCYLSSCDVLAMPSTNRAEAFGLVAVESMACGIPVITTELGTGTSFHNIDKKTGRIIKPNDSFSLMESIQDICINISCYNKDIIRHRAEDFSLAEFKRKFLDLIKKIES